MMLVHLLADTIPQLGEPGTGVSTDGAAGSGFVAIFKQSVADPLLLGLQFLIPAFVAIAALHKLMDHKESGGAFILEILLRGFGAVAILQLVKALIV